MTEIFGGPLLWCIIFKICKKILPKPILTLYLPGYSYTLFVLRGGNLPLLPPSKNQLVSDRRKIFWILKLFFVEFLKINILRLRCHENNDDIIETSKSL